MEPSKDRYPTQREADRPVRQNGIYDGAWSGRECFVVGGGPSLRGFDWSLLRGRLVVGTNAAWRLDPAPAFTIVRDQRLMRSLIEDSAFLESPGVKMFHRGQMPDDLHTPYDVPSSGLEWGTSLDTGLIYSPDCGLMAINLADVLGVRVIYLLGFDMLGERGRTAYWHADYPEDWRTNECVYRERFIPFYEKYAPRIRAEVINLNPKSGLTCFHRADWKSEPSLCAF